MEILNFTFDAQSQVTGRTLVGCVGSGDLEILVEPNAGNNIHIQITTSVDGSASRWENLLTRIFAVQNAPAVKIEINDFGATPGVVRLRLEQALEEVQDAK
ncbi:MAG: malonate decarboxylase subunit delta [Acinetobacter sp.]